MACCGLVLSLFARPVAALGNRFARASALSFVFFFVRARTHTISAEEQRPGFCVCVGARQNERRQADGGMPKKTGLWGDAVRVRGVITGSGNWAR